MNGPRRIVTLQVLRGIAANMVVISHVMGAEHRHLHGILPSELTVGFAGVDIFFVLSGFVMVLVSDRSPFIFL
jgi:peptidoglycan/LPS O-acetylase OafA/YrhL